MSGSQRKKPILFIGATLFMAIAIVGAVVELILDRDGLIAIAAAIIAFIILAITLVIEAISRRAAEKRALQEQNGSLPQFDIPSDQRFIRHQKDEPAEFDPLVDFENYDDGFGELASGFDDNTDPVDRMSESPSATLRRRAAELRANSAPEAADEEDPFDTYGQPEIPVETELDAGNDYFDELGDDGFDSMDEEDYPTEEEYALAEEPAQPEYINEPKAEESPAAEIQPEIIDQPEFRPVKSFVAPAAQQEPAPQPAPAPMPVPVPVQPAAAAPTAGQTLESFYENMSDEDILYRDCVEVWAADAKPSVLRLIKYVENIEDKQTQALFGRDLEYVNAMIDRIYCFTQLEYVDELLELQQHNFATLVKECLKRFSPFFMEKRLGLLWKGLDVEVMTDRRWFIFALTQVIFNSVEFTPEGGKIAISAKKNDGYIDLTIDDSGKGISSDELPCVFIAGYMGDDSPNESGRRTGMGLFIAQSVLRKMGGDAFIESNPGKGTRVTLRVPAIAPTAN